MPVRYTHNTLEVDIHLLHRMSDDLVLLDRKYQFTPADNYWT